MGPSMLFGIACGVLFVLAVRLLMGRTAYAGSCCGPRRKICVLFALAAILPGLVLSLSRHRATPAAPAQVPAVAAPAR